MKPRILIAMHYMELGGAESALLGLLQAHDPNRADIDLFLYAHRGELMSFIPKEKITLLPEIPIYSMLESPIKDVLIAGYRKLALARLFARHETSKYSKYNIKKLDNASGFTFQQNRTFKLLPKINPALEYDLAISFLTPHYIVLNNVNAKKKLGWIHTDYTSVFINQEMELNMWNRLDYIATISEEVGNKFCEVFPSLKGKIVHIENILSSSFIRQRAEEFIPNDYHKKEGIVNLLSIGRYSHPKRFDQIGTLCRMVVDKLREKGSNLDLKWYVIGYGSKDEENKMYENILKENIQDHVIVIGKQTNPYPYIKACDVYVQASRFEGKSITVREAQILCKPIIVSDYPTAHSQIIDGIDGVIAPMGNKEFSEELALFVLNNSLQDRLIEYLSSHEYGNESEIEKIYNLVANDS